MSITSRLRKRGKHWYYSLRTPDKQTKLVSTSATEKGEAVRIVKESGLYALDTAARSTRLTNKSIAYLTTGKRMTIAKALKPFEGRLSIRSAGKHTYNAIGTVRSWIKFSGVENLSPAAIGPEHIAPFINNPESAAKASTRRVSLSHLKTFFDFCVDTGWTVRQPANLVEVNMDILTHAQKETKAIEPYTLAEVRSLITRIRWERKWCQKEIEKLEAIPRRSPDYAQARIDLGAKKHRLLFWESAVALAANTGLRFGDIACLEWDCFNTPGVLVVHTAKRNKRVTPRLVEEMEEVVSQIPVRHARFLFPEEREIAIDPKQRAKLSVWFGRLCKHIKVPYKPFHGLRHGFASERYRAGDDIKKIGKDLGHSLESTTKGYIHV